MIVAGPFCQCIKTGAYFSIDNDDRVFTGDLFYDFGKREFQMRGVPSWDGTITHVLPVKERGPVAIHLLVKGVLQSASRGDGKYTDFRFRNADASAALATFIEEWHGDQSVMGAIEEFWAIKPNLAWHK